MNLEPLYGYQKENANHLLSLLVSRGSAADRSDMGTGKTYTAAVVARESGLSTIVVTPKSTIPNWWHVASKVGGKINAVVNYESLRSGKYSFYSKRDGWCLPERSLIIFDEAHRLRGRRTLQTFILTRAKEGGHAVLLLSATLVSSALDLSAIGFALGLFPTPKDWWPWARRHGGYINRWGGYDASTDASVLTRLSEEMAKVSCRSRIEDLGLDLPCITTADLVDCGDLQQLVDIIDEVQHEAAAEEDEDKYDAAALIARGRAREMSEQAKVGYLVEETNDLVSRGYSVVLFVNYEKTLWDLYTQFTDVSVITGGQSALVRQNYIEDFQSNKSHVLVANIKAGGVGLNLHDTSGNHPRVALVSPPESAIDLLQALGRIRRVGMASPGVNRILFAARSVEQKVYKRVSKKLSDINLINDADLEYDKN